MQSLSDTLPGSWSISQHYVSWAWGRPRLWSYIREEMPFPLGAGQGAVEPADLDWHAVHICSLLGWGLFLKPS